MAIDTANKRSSAMNIGCPWRARLPFPDSTINAADRAHIDYLYAGLSAAAGETQYRYVLAFPRRIIFKQTA
jgi:hypothetical protein